MGLAIDTIAGHAINPGANAAGVTLATGDSLTIRNFSPTSKAFLEHLTRQGATSGMVRARSPLLHDNVTGIQYYSGEVTAFTLLPPQVGQPVQATDTLIVEVTGGTAETDLAVASVYYQDLVGGAARLHSWGDISGMIRNIKPVHVAVTTSATIGTWEDTVLTTSENLLHSGRDYAVLGYLTDAALAYVAVKGQETNNLRVGGPGQALSMNTEQFFVDMDAHHGYPHIPVFNAANVQSIYVSTLADTASVAANVTLVCAELATNLAT